ncbi:response regulator transcription factor [Candidatus Methylospira mobilis]|uniref:Response regulator transcription factor n=1 Tax=Candidatus Methylospira mobilis TaxID=1808979 RepID=A0A5Q0BJI8_9GAMM|nr:response regulator transcription factor [Candidatus Methylospira mobilis]QFY42371.1 response regulator transcription factor [Candidatus Methylospira mobilis]
MIRLLIADDHAILRDGLKNLFAFVDDITVAAEAADHEQLLDKLKQERFDLILLDMNMPGLHGVDLIARIRADDKQVPILILSMYSELPIVQRALKAGASGYLTKGSGGAILIEAIRKVANGGHFIEHALAEQIFFAAGVTGKTSLRHEKLSKREIQTLCLLGRGDSVSEIGAKLNISSKTASSHKCALMQKMGFTNNADLVRYAMENGLTDES